VDVDVQRGGVSVDVGDRYWELPFFEGIGFIAWELVMPATIPGTGTWSFTCAQLVDFAAQDVGTIIVGNGVYPAHLAAGVITTDPAIVIAATNKVTIRGAVTV
jgi:hypothetical protein